MARTVEVLRRALGRSREAGVAFTAAGVAYYALVALLPLLVLVFLALATLRGETVARRLVLGAGELLSPTGRRLLREAVLSATGRVETAGLGVAVLLWGGVRLFRALDTAFAQVYGTGGESTLAGELRDAAVALGAVVLAATAVAAGGAVLGSVADGSGLLGVLLRTVVRLLVLVVLLVPLYYVLPEPSVGVPEVLPGAVVAAGGWLLLRVAFDTYVGLAGGNALYGAFAGLVLFVSLLYVASLVVLVGATVNAVVAESR